MEETIDEKHARLQAIFVTLDPNEIKTVGHFVGLEDQALVGTRRTLSRLVLNKIDTDIDTYGDDAESTLAFLGQILAKMEGVQRRETPEVEVVDVNDGGANDGGDHWKARFDRLAEDYERLKFGEGMSVRQKVFVKGDFKLKGVIGRPGGGVSFASLRRQVDAARLEYDERKICEAVIQGVDISTTLRFFFENKQDLNLDSLMAIMKAFYKESDSTELYNQLGNASQNNGEDALNYVMRLMELKGKILGVSATSEILYGKKQVQTLFLKSVENGLLSENVRIKLRGHLDMNMTDEKLLEVVSEIVMAENERVVKMKRSTRGIKKVEVVEPEGEKEKVDELKTVVEKLSAEVKLLREETSRGAGRRFARGCNNCRKVGAGDSCRHCWKCGKNGHLSSWCSENE